jgi:membrane associated rhomboid family serine protease
MLPLRDNIRSLSFPYVNTALIAACVVVFFAQLSAPDGGQSWAFVPRMLVSGRYLVGAGISGVLLAMLASTFMHSGFLHIAINMLFLWVFGDNVEDRMGHLRYLLFYLLCGMVAALAHSLFSGFSTVPIVGASGAIAGVLGAYLVLFRHSTIRALVILLFFGFMVDLPAPVFLLYWFILQLFSGVATIMAPTGVAFWAHIGGFAAGYLLVRGFARRLRPPPSRRVTPRILSMRVD